MPATIAAITSLAVVGLSMLGFGIYVWRNAETITRDARTQLQGRFGATMPALFAAPPSPSGARIPAVAALAIGLVLVGAAVVVALVQ